MIVTSVVPPEFPLTMSFAVTLSLIHLLQKSVYCTEPFRLPFAGKLNVCCFDKTGTLTADKMDVEGVVGIDGSDPPPQLRSQTSLNNGSDAKGESQDNKTRKKRCEGQTGEDTDGAGSDEEFRDRLEQSLGFLTTATMAACHSLAPLDGKEVGDPLEVAAVKAVGWRLLSMDTVSSGGPHATKLHVLKRFPFSSELQRMTVVARLEGQPVGWSGNPQQLPPHQGGIPPGATSGILVLSKGSPEMMKRFLKTVPPNYDNLQSTYALLGHRVLCIAGRWLGTPNGTTMTTMERKAVEVDLEFAGFLVLGCAVKPHTRQALQQLLKSSHRLVMITGDNPLTACQVALDVGIAQKPIVLLQRSSEGAFSWVSRTGTFVADFKTGKTLKKLTNKYDLCVTGALAELLPEAAVTELWTMATVLARTSPQQKEGAIAAMNANGHITLMCGDGTNDVGALKMAHIGVSLLSSAPRVVVPQPLTTNAAIESIRNRKRTAVGGRDPRGKKVDRRTTMELEDELPVTRLGDASIASPFTYRGDSIKCIPSIVRFGRGTLSTVLMMYKLMGLNSLVMAFALSVLTLDGVKLGDLQTSVESIAVSVLFFAASRATPSKRLTPHRPVESLFAWPVVMAMLGQTAVHIITLVLGWKMACAFRDADFDPDVDGKFHPNLVNTVVFFIYASIHASSFIANYEGPPFLSPLSANKPLRTGLEIFFVGFFVLVSEVFPSLNEFMSLVPTPNWEFKQKLLGLIAADLGLAYAIGRICIAVSRQKVPQQTT